MILASIGRGRNEGFFLEEAADAPFRSAARVRRAALAPDVGFLRGSACSLAMALSRVRLAGWAEARRRRSSVWKAALQRDWAALAKSAPFCPRHSRRTSFQAFPE